MRKYLGQTQNGTHIYVSGDAKRLLSELAKRNHTTRARTVDKMLREYAKLIGVKSNG